MVLVDGGDGEGQEGRTFGFGREHQRVASRAVGRVKWFCLISKALKFGQADWKISYSEFPSDRLAPFPIGRKCTWHLGNKATSTTLLCTPFRIV